MPDDGQLEQRYALGVAYPANRVDLHDEFMDAADVEHACWGFLQAGADVGLQHADGSLGHATVVESYIYRGPDWTVGDTTVHAGDWLLGVIFDPPTWADIKAGKYTGWSLQGIAKHVLNTTPKEALL